MQDLAERGMAIIMISSELPEILGMSDRIAVMHAGTIVATMTGMPRTPQCYGGGAGALRKGQGQDEPGERLRPERGAGGAPRSGAPERERAGWGPASSE